MSRNRTVTAYEAMHHGIYEIPPFGSTSIWQGRNMVYPGLIDPYFLAVILIPEPR